MLRFLLSVGAVFVLIISTCLLPQTVAARRCPVKEPETLLSLYQNSDAIYVATFDKTVEGEVVDDNDDYTSVEIRKHFTISSTLKGQSRKFFVLEDTDYRYKTMTVRVDPEQENEEPEASEPEAAEAEPAITEEIGEEEIDPAELKNGDTLLLFIRNGDKDEAPALTDYRDGIKKLSPQHIGVYEARINELNSIFSAKKVNPARVVDWLIRCAEDPATRWEGTFELMRSVRNQRWRDEAERRRQERIASGQPVEEIAVVDDSDEEQASRDAKHIDTDIFAKLIDANHKQTLANILLNFRSETREKGEYVKGDRELIQLVSEWGDPRFAGFLIDQIKAESSNAPYTAERMNMLADILKSSELTDIAERYSETMYEADADEVDNESASEEADIPEVEPAPDALPADNKDEPAGKEPATVGDVDPAEKPAAKKVTYKELRTELLQKFLAECDKAIANRDSAKVAKAKR